MGRPETVLPYTARPTIGASEAGDGGVCADNECIFRARIKLAVRFYKRQQREIRD